MTDPLQLTRDLIAIPSPTGQEGAVVAFLAERLERLGWAVRRQPVTPGRDNLYATRGTPVVVLSTHLDVVPPNLPVRDDPDRIHGRGACDAKGIAAAMIAAAERLAAEGETRVALLFVVGEENGSDGAMAAAALEPKGRFLVNGEPTENRLAIAQKGALRISLRAEGRAAHSGYPALGVSAIDRLLNVIERIRRIPLPTHEVLGPSTLNVGTLRAGEAPNVIAPSAEAELLIRLIGPSDAIRAAVLAAAEDGVTITFPLEIPALHVPPLDGWEHTVVAFSSDLPFFADWGPGYQLGPGTIHVAHTDQESIAKAELLEGVERYVALARALLAEVPA